MFFCFCFFPPLLYFSPRKFASSKDTLKPNRSFNKKERSLAPESHLHVNGPGSCPTVIESLPRHKAHTPPCTHLTDPPPQNTAAPPRSSWLLLHPLTTAKLETESCAVGEAQSWAPVNHVARRPLCSDANMCTTARVRRTEDTPAGHPPGRPAFLASKQISSTWVLGPVPSLFLLSFSFSWCFTGKTHPVWLLEQKWSLTKGPKAEEQSDDGSENQSTPSLVFLGRLGRGWAGDM